MTTKAKNTESDTNTTNSAGTLMLEKLMAKIADLEAKLNSTPVKAEPVYNTTSKRSPLQPGKKVELIPINKGVTTLIRENSEEASMLHGTSRTICVPIDNKMFRLIDPLEAWEKEFLQEVLGLNLNIYSKDTNGVYDCFYAKSEAKIKFTKTTKKLESATVKLDLGDPYDYLRYKIALSSPEVAKSWADRKNPSYNYVVKDIDAEFNEQFSVLNKEDTVIAYLLSITKNRKALFDLLRLYGYNAVKITKTHSADFLYNELRNISKTTKGINALYKIISLAEKNPRELEMQVFIEDAVSSGALIKRGSQYSLEGGEIIGIDKQAAISFLEDVMNQSVRLRINAEIENYLKK